MIKTVRVTDVFDTFCYFYIDEKTGHGFLIDPGAEAEKLLRIIEENHWTIEKILLTHGHFDHTGAAEEISKKLGISCYIHENGKLYLENTGYNLSRYCKRNVILKEAEYVKDRDILSLDVNDNFQLEVLHVPGHTGDSVIFYSADEHVAFVGDTIFKDSLANTQYPGSDQTQYRNSLINVVFRLPEETMICPGHSEVSTIGAEMMHYIR